MEPSQSSPVDSLHLSPSMDALQSIREIYESTDSDEDISSSKILKSSESINPHHQLSTPSSPAPMEPSQSSLVDSVHPSPFTDAIESISDMYQKTDPAKEIDPLIIFVDNQLQKMNTLPSRGGSSSSDGWLETVPDGTDLAAKTIHTISTEAEKLSDSDAVKSVGSVTLEIMNGVKDLHCVLIGLSVAAYAVVRYRSVGYTDKEWRGLLLKILELSKHVKQYSQEMPERERLCNAVGTIVEGAIIFCDYLERKKGSRHRFMEATIAACAQNTNEAVKVAVIGRSGREGAASCDPRMLLSRRGKL